MNSLLNVKRELQKAVVPGKAKDLMGFFKTGPGDCGEGDVFIGVTVPEQRKIARRYYKEIPLDDLEKESCGGRGSLCWLQPILLEKAGLMKPWPWLRSCWITRTT